MSKLAFSVPFSIISNKPTTTTTEEFDAFHGFMLITRSSSGDEIANVNCFTMTSCTYYKVQ